MAAVCGAQLCLAESLAAQAPTARAAIAAFDDSLAAITSLDQLAPFLDAPANHAGGRDPMRHLRHGLVLLRQGAITGSRDPLDDAIRAFDDATRHSSSEWPWPALGLARARLALAELGAVVKPSRFQSLGELHPDAAADDLARALSSDSTFTPAAHLIAALLADWPGDYPESLHESVRAAAAVVTHGPGMQLLLGRLERHLGRDSAALAAFRTYAARGGDRGVALLESARTLSRMGDDDGGRQAYLDGVLQAGRPGRSAYRADLAYVVSRGELAEYDALAQRTADGGGGLDPGSGQALAEWVSALWRRRDAAALRSPGDRLAEHLRRWSYAMHEFRVPSRYWDTPAARTATRRTDITGTTEDLTELVMASTLTVGPVGDAEPEPGRIVDDHGFIYIRHGEPSARVHCPGGDGNPPTVTWVYDFPEGTVLLHFAGGRLTDIPSMVVDRLGSTGTGRAGFPVETCFNRLASVDSRFGVLAAMREGAAQLAMTKALASALVGGGGPRTYVSDPSAGRIEALARRDRAAAERALTTDSYPLRFEEDLAPVIQLFAVGTAASETGVLGVFSVRADRLDPGPAAPDGRTTYPVQVRFAAIDSSGRVLRIVDTLRTFAVRAPLPRDAWISGTVEMPLGSGTYDVRLLLSQPASGRGGAGGRLGVAIPGDANSLSMSDVVTGLDGSLVWRGHGIEVPLNPLGAYPHEATAELYYELGGLRPGTRYRTTIEISRGEGDSDRIAVTFTETADTPVLRSRRSLGLATLPPGRYVLSVTIEEQGTTRRVSRERWLDVRSRQ